jgi:hypothetical protein
VVQTRDDQRAVQHPYANNPNSPAPSTAWLNASSRARAKASRTECRGDDETRASGGDRHETPAAENAR